MAYDLLFLGITACRIFLDKFPLQEFFLGGIVTAPPVISNGPSLSANYLSHYADLTVVFAGTKIRTEITTC